MPVAMSTFGSLSLAALLISAARIALCTPIASSQNERPTATLSAGVISGTTTSVSSATVNEFLGVRFGAPPQRFALPQPAQPWTGVYDASSFQATCIQQFNGPDAARNSSIAWFDTPPPPTTESEDCLFLNIWAPAGASANGTKAVMLWFYGGGFVFGSGALPAYNGASFAANQDVIIVTFNYRTGVFGFPGSPQIPVSQQNLGLFDQRLALQWVYENIAAFGGDRQKITIFGQSAGSGSIDALITAPPPDPIPFSAAILESGIGTVSLPKAASATSWQRLVVSNNCTLSADKLACMRAVPASQLNRLSEQDMLSFAPVHDGGVTYADHPRAARLESQTGGTRVARVPVLAGSNANDGGPFVYGVTNATLLLEGILPQGLPANTISQLLAAYPIGSVGIPDANAQLAILYTEVGFQCPTAIVTNDSVTVDIPAWRYYYNASFPNKQIYPGCGAFHSAEIYEVYGTYPQDNATPFEIELSVTLQKAWADFAKNPAAGPGWTSAPAVAMLGGGATPGQPDTGRQPVTIISPSQIDQRCPVVDALYELVDKLPTYGH